MIFFYAKMHNGAIFSLNNESNGRLLTKTKIPVILYEFLLRRIVIKTHVSLIYSQRNIIQFTDTEMKIV